jgi:hypothetical protein
LYIHNAHALVDSEIFSVYMYIASAQELDHIAQLNINVGEHLGSIQLIKQARDA